MHTKKRFALVLVHDLAKKPVPEMLEEIWQCALMSDDPKDDFFLKPNPGVDLNEDVPVVFNHYADVFYGSTNETEFGSAIQKEERGFPCQTGKQIRTRASLLSRMPNDYCSIAISQSGTVASINWLAGFLNLIAAVSSADVEDRGRAVHRSGMLIPHGGTYSHHFRSSPGRRQKLCYLFRGRPAAARRVSPLGGGSAEDR
jgi:hypothetical protein